MVINAAPNLLYPLSQYSRRLISIHDHPSDNLSPRCVIKTWSCKRYRLLLERDSISSFLFCTFSCLFVCLSPAVARSRRKTERSNWFRTFFFYILKEQRKTKKTLQRSNEVGKHSYFSIGDTSSENLRESSKVHRESSSSRLFSYRCKSTHRAQHDNLKSGIRYNAMLGRSLIAKIAICTYSLSVCMARGNRS